MSETPQTANAQRPVIFVGGAPRSGTTVTHALLCTSEKANAYCPEISFVRPIVNGYAVGMQNWKNHTNAFFKNPNEFRLHMRGQVLRSLNVVAEAMGSPEVLVVKDPLMTPLFYWLNRMIPQMKFVTVVRNPNDVVRSRQEVVEKMGRPFTADVAREAATEYMQSYAHLDVPELAAAVFALRYDDLTDDTVIDKLREFTGLPDVSADKVWTEERAVNQNEAANPWFSPKYHRPINTENRLDPLAPEFRKVVAEVCGPLMARFGWS
jgi:hypothetical protein